LWAAPVVTVRTQQVAWVAETAAAVLKVAPAAMDMQYFPVVVAAELVISALAE
jgi:hypothetical protein